MIFNHTIDCNSQVEWQWAIDLPATERGTQTLSSRKQAALDTSTFSLQIEPPSSPKQACMHNFNQGYYLVLNVA